MFRSLLVIAIFSMGGHAISAAVPEFTDADWAGVPTPGVLSVDEVMELFVGPIEKSGREWTLASFDNDRLTVVMDDREFDIKEFVGEDLFAHQCFNVDSSGVLKSEVFLVSRTKTHPREEGDGDMKFYIMASLPITTPLTAAELMNPIVKAVQSTLTFEAESRLVRENMPEYMRTIGIKHARDLLIFIRPDRIDEMKAEFNEVSAGIAAFE
jgi:hypothetical protein